MSVAVSPACSTRETLRYIVYKASGLTSTKARKLYGFEKMNSRALRVDDSIVEMKWIHEAVDEMASIQDKAVLSMQFWSELC